MSSPRDDGHYKGAHATAARDAVKNCRAQSVRGTDEHGNALRRAGIGYVEVVGGDHTPAELRRVVEKLVQRN